MHTLKFYMIQTPRLVRALQSELQGRFSSVEPFQLDQAIANGLRLRSLTQLDDLPAHGAEIATDPTAFRTTLAHYGFVATEREFLEAAAGVALAMVLAREPRLTNEGIVQSTFEDGDAVLRTGQSLMGPIMRSHFLRAFALLYQLRPTKRVSRSCRSYALKHMAEGQRCVFPGGELLGPGPVANGALIAAAIYLGFEYEASSDRFGGSSPNAFFNIDLGSLNRLDAEIRLDR